MPILVKKRTHLWLKNITTIIESTKSAEAQDIVSSAFAAQVSTVDELLEKHKSNLQGKAKVQLLLNFWVSLKEKEFINIPQSTGLLARIGGIFKSQERVEQERLRAYYMKKMMDIFQIIFETSVHSQWLKSDQDFDMIRKLMNCLFDKLAHEFHSSASVLDSGSRMPFELIDFDDDHYEIKYPQVELHSNTTQAVLLPSTEQRQLVVRNEELRLQVVSLQQSLEEEAALSLQRKELSEKLMSTVEEQSGVISGMRVKIGELTRERNQGRRDLSAMEGKLKQANEALKRALEAQSDDDLEEDVRPIKKSPLRQNGHFRSPHSQSRLRDGQEMSPSKLATNNVK